MRNLSKIALLGAAFLVLVVLALKASVLLVPSGTWAPAANLAEPRAGASAALLADGHVFVTGGEGVSGALATAELFGTDGSVSPAAPMNVARSKHLSVVLQDGRVLVAGGTSSGGGATNAAEIYDLATNSWSSLAGGMTEARSGATAALLQDGRILIAGGDNAGVASSTIEIFDPVSSTFSFAGALSSPRENHAMALLADGRVLIVGGSNGSAPLASTDIIDPAAGSVAPGPSLAAPRFGHSATTLLDGRVLVAGGNNGQTDLASAEIYDPSAGTFSPATSTLAAPRQGHLAFLLPHNNNVLIVGGTSAGAPVAASELFTPWQGTFAGTAALTTARSAAAGSAMQQDGLLLVAGGSDANDAALASTELYGFATVKTDQADYAPGTTVTITGSGWQPGETVTLTLVESPLIDTHPPLTAVADANGNIFNNQFSPDSHDIGILFYLTATGSVSQAQTTFTDAGPKPSSTITFPANNGSYNSTGWTGTLAGTGSFSTGTTSRLVTVSVKRNGTTNRFWNGSGFTSSSEVFFPATGTTAWTLSFSFSNFPADDSYTVHSQASDSNGTETGSTTATFTIDTAPPAAPSKPGLAPGSDSGSSQSDSISSVTTDLKFNGAAEAHSTVNLFVDGSSSSSGTGTTNPGGNWNNINVAGPLSEGLHSIAAKATDAAGNTSALSALLTVTIDTTAPTATITANPANPSSSTAASFSFTGNDPTSGGVSSGVDHFVCQLDSGSFNICTSPDSFTGLATGSHTFQVEAVDFAGNTGTPTSFTWSIVTDVTPPTTTITLAPSAPNGSNNWYKTDVGVSVSAADNAGGTGVTETRCVLDPGSAPATFDAIPAGCAYLSPGANVTSEGQHVLYAASKDNAGNKETLKSSSFQIDKTPPYNVSGAPNRAADYNGWYNHAVDVVFTGNDDTSGIASCTTTTYSSPDGSSLTVNGTCMDNTGNTSTAVASSAFNYDSTPPYNVSVSADRVPDSNGWYNHSFTATWTGNDDTSGIDSCTSTNYGGPDTNSGSLPGSCTDKAGNVSTPVVNFTFKYDDVASISSISLNPGAPDGSYGWHVHNVHVTVSATDNLSGVAETRCVLDPAGIPASFDDLPAGCGYAGLGADVTTDGMHVIYAASKDAAANKEMTVKSVSFKIDKTPPTITFVSRTPANGFGWNNTNVTVNWSCSDATSGPVLPSDSQTVITEDAKQSATGTCTDYAGNTASNTQTGISIDKTKPTITITMPVNGATYILNQAVVAEYGCADQPTLSGVDTCVGPVASGSNIDTSSVGSKSFTVTATDRAGNTFSQTVNYTVQYNVCLLYDPTRAVKSGATYPIKFYLCGASSNDVSSSGIIVKAISILQISANDPGVEDSGNANPDNNFRYDSTLGPSGGYIFNLQTKGFLTGTYSMMFTAGNDPTTHSTGFAVK